ncbi:ABC transporter permease [Halopenitus persicus]|uniref:Spermidine/putrescine transport system permease protein n=1 Tax=Halopenitus persicus TaxID=1048396 RepID=A0A1H3H943_9EURY|nr:ABC transporter permease [Halopenitus persicus]QHS16059.1 ABC transporter permease [haloarchaeon 3A1-DGR]SDY11947.1 spermidine/putrescine transport system permease protein [Halopenitus persicus]
MTSLGGGSIPGGFTESVLAAVDRLNGYVYRNRRIVPAVQLLVGLLVLSTFLVSIAIIVFYSVLQQAPPEEAIRFTVGNYVEFINNDLYTSVFWDSFVISVKTTLATLALAYPVAYLLAFSDTRWKNVLVLLIVLPFWINLVIRTYAWRLIFSEQGIINYLFIEVLGVVDQPMGLLFSQNAIVVGLVHVLLPYMVLPLYVSMDKIDESHVEAAKNLGANKLQAFYEVTLPQSIPGAATGVAISFVLAFGAFVIPLLLGGDSHIMIANVIGDTYIQYFDWSLGSAMAIAVTAFVLLIVFLFNRVVGLEGLYGGGEAS